MMPDASRRTPDALFDAEFHATLAALRRALRTDARSRPFGTRPIRRSGHGQEFLGHRSYEAGDDLRAVDWNAYGRTERLFSKTFWREESGTWAILLDASASMGFGVPSKFDAARRLAGVAGALALWNDGALDVRCAQNRWQGAGGVDAVLARYLGFLRSLRPSEGPTLPKELASLGRLSRGARLLIVTDGWDLPGCEAALRAAVPGPASAAVVRLLCASEKVPAAPVAERSGVVRLLDSETGRAVRLDVGEAAAARYAEVLDRWTASCRESSLKAGAAWVDLASEDPLSAQVRKVLEALSS
ncbi:MAG: DUF58 domain-containing protein [Planctomycetes bacterium]|nr:DUF58 domain-containing protein [Planctomycetota bacterium]